MGFNVEKSNALRDLLITMGLDPKLISDFMEEQINLNRATDGVSKGVLGKNEFYKREIVYSQIESLIINLK